MAQFRTSADLLDLALDAAGEVTNGNSSYETQALGFLNAVHFSLIAGGTIPLGKDHSIEVDEVWPWARASRPMIIELQPKYNTGTVALTLGSESGTFSNAPSYSVAGWYLVIPGRSEVLRIASHTASATAFEIDGAYPDASVTASVFTVAKLDYDLVPDYLVIDSTNNKIQFQKAASSPLTGTLTSGSYTPAQLATHVASVITAAISGPTVTGTYSAITRKFTLTSDLAGATLFQIIGDGTSSAQSVHKLMGYDDETSTSAAAQTSTYALGGIARLIEPIKIHKGTGTGSLSSVDAETFQRNYPLREAFQERYPDRFSVVREGADGSLTIRMNGYPVDKTRIEVERIEVPRDLKDNSSSIPLVPRKWIDVLKDAVAFYICFLKNDDKMQIFSALVQGKIQAMVSQHRGGLVRSGENFGQIVARPDMIKRRSLFPTEPY